MFIIRKIIFYMQSYVLCFLCICANSLPGWRLCLISSTSSNLLNFITFLDRFSKNSPISNFMKIRPVGDELFHADGRIDMRKLYSSEISPTRCNNCVFILRNCFTLQVSGDNLTHHQEYICCIWPQVSRLT